MEYNEFTGLYPVSKTLRFELRPLKETVEHMAQIVEQDERKAESYKRVKKLIDEYHKFFINRVLEGVALPQEHMKAYYRCYQIKKRNEAERDELRTVQAKLRGEVVKYFKEDKVFKKLLSPKDLIKEVMPSFLTSDVDLKLVDEFKDFTTYFVGFNENRANMYSAEEKHTAIAYRLVNENMPKYFDNMAAYTKIKTIEGLEGELVKGCCDLLESMQVKSIGALFELDYLNKTLTQQQIEKYNEVVGKCNECINLYNQKHTNAKMPKFKALFKQILCDRTESSFSIEAYKTNNEVLRDIRDFYEELSGTVLGEGNLKAILENLDAYDLGGIFVRNEDIQLNAISKRMFGDWRVIKDAVMKYMETQNPRKKKEDDVQYHERIGKLFDKIESFSIRDLDFCIDNYVRLVYVDTAGKRTAAY